jgi:hypothetical protein
MKSSIAFLVLLGLLFAPASLFAVGLGQTDDFEDGSVQGWIEGGPSPNMPTNISDGGPLGAGDNYLENISAGGFGAGSRLVMYNQSQWTGDYIAAGITRIQADMANFGSSALSMRISIEQNFGNIFASTNAVNLPADGQWYSVVFDLTASDMSFVSGSLSLNDVLGGVDEMRILSAAGGPTHMGDSIVANLGVDNIRAVPAPGALSLLAFGCMTVFRRTRR